MPVQFLQLQALSLARGQRPVREHRAVVVEELLPELRAAFGNFREISEVLGLVVGVHAVSSGRSDD